MEGKKRGRGYCPKCNKGYFNRYKPEKCPDCNEHLGGTHSRSKKAKTTATCPSAVEVTPSVFSVATTNRGNRCFVTRNVRDWICLHGPCKEKRAMHINTGATQQFTCEHINKAVDEAAPPVRALHVSDEALGNYPCNSVTTQRLKSALQHAKENEFAPVVQLSSENYAVFCEGTATDTIGFCHVTHSKDSLTCSGKNCRKVMAKGKQKAVKANCIHMHMLCMAKGMSQEGADLEKTKTGHPTDTVAKDSTADSHDDQKPSAREITIDIALKKKLPYELSKETINIIMQRDNHTWEGKHNGWPEEFEPAATECQNCGSPLSPSKFHSGQKGQCYLISELNPFKAIDIKVKTCTNTECVAMHQATPFDIGLFNVADKLMVSFDIMLELREFFKTGHPLGNAIKAKMNILRMKCHTSPSDSQMEYIEDLLYNGFFMYEALTDRDMNDVICGLCGVCPEICLGDGNAKNCCSNAQVDYDRTSPLNNSAILTLDNVLEKVKRSLVEKGVYTRNKSPFKVGIGQLPPIIPSAIANEEVVNTEVEKESIYLRPDGTGGDPAALHQIIMADNVDIENLNALTLEDLRALAKECNIKTSSKSKVALVGDIYALYSSILVGLSPCHNFTKIPGKTGGFYHIVCRHGCTVASKFLTLTESVRDAADLYMSMKYPPVVFINDTPCGFARHMECRLPQFAKKLWGDRSGCFEKPTLEREPNDNHNVPAIVPPEYRDKTISPQSADDSRSSRTTNEAAGIMHPMAGTCEKYILGDRFHNSSDPHKSPLCQYHNINLCAQANTVTTSTQECQNYRKNARRLRSTSHQNFVTHIFFNYLMDFYQNEEIVEKQRKNLSKSKKEDEVLVRDAFHRFRWHSCR